MACLCGGCDACNRSQGREEYDWRSDARSRSALARRAAGIDDVAEAIEAMRVLQARIAESVR